MTRDRKASLPWHSIPALFLCPCSVLCRRAKDLQAKTWKNQNKKGKINHCAFPCSWAGRCKGKRKGEKEKKKQANQWDETNHEKQGLPLGFVTRQPFFVPIGGGGKRKIKNRDWKKKIDQCGETNASQAKPGLALAPSSFFLWRTFFKRKNKKVAEKKINQCGEAAPKQGLLPLALCLLSSPSCSSCALWQGKIKSRCQIEVQ